MSQNAILQKYAINNGADSDDQAENDMTPFINIFNEFYAKETSKKIRAIFKAKGQAWKSLSSTGFGSAFFVRFFLAPILSLFTSFS